MNPPRVVVPGRRGQLLPFQRHGRARHDLDALSNANHLEKRFRDAWNGLQRLKAHFAPQRRRFKYRRCLGWGGNGLAAAFDELDEQGEKARSVVVKSMFRVNEEARFHEIDNSRWFLFLFSASCVPRRASGGFLGIFADVVHYGAIHQKAEHIIQLAYADGEGVIDEEGDNEMSNTSTEPTRGDEYGNEEDVPRVTTIITEMLENGDLSNFIVRVREHNQKVPITVLWRFFLCLVRMCIGLAYPPASLRENNNVPGPITERVPNRLKDNPKRMVHFDIDPKNIFVGDVLTGEHSVSPLLKLGDFGLATEIEPDSTDTYYELFRNYGKRGFYAPEQFCADWNYIQPTMHLLMNHEIAGNYGWHTNVWGIGLTMETLITLCYPQQPPHPVATSLKPPEGKSRYDSYGVHLLSEEYSRVDHDLLAAVIRCQAHLPADRPPLHELEKYVSECAGTRVYPGESFDEVLAWTEKILYEPPDDSPSAAATPLPPIPAPPIRQPQGPPGTLGRGPVDRYPGFFRTLLLRCPYGPLLYPTPPLCISSSRETPPSSSLLLPPPFLIGMAHSKDGSLLIIRNARTGQGVQVPPNAPPMQQVPPPLPARDPERTSDTDMADPPPAPARRFPPHAGPDPTSDSHGSSMDWQPGQGRARVTHPYGRPPDTSEGRGA
ncbi:kinase-like domain-containing protein [Xylariaceae sp. FL1651]|nr:kinase-like domain-containing protein [Xylariaceae sp. FL1651]